MKDHDLSAELNFMFALLAQFKHRNDLPHSVWIWGCIILIIKATFYCSDQNNEKWCAKLEFAYKCILLPIVIIQQGLFHYSSTSANYISENICCLKKTVTIGFVQDCASHQRYASLFHPATTKQCKKCAEHVSGTSSIIYLQKNKFDQIYLTTMVSFVNFQKYSERKPIYTKYISWCECEYIDPSYQTRYYFGCCLQSCMPTRGQFLKQQLVSLACVTFKLCPFE